MSKSAEMFQEASRYLVGGACAGGRFHRILGRPLYMDHVDGSHLYDVDGNEWIDYHCGAGALLFGHNHPRLKEVVMQCAEKSFFMNLDSEYTIEFAKLFTQLIPTVEKIRLNNSGTEATMAALRVARAYTGKNLIIKMDGHFHGMHEMIWYNGGYGTEINEFGETKEVRPEFKGFPKGGEENVKLIEFNNIDAVKYVFEKYRGQIAAIIMEPVNYDCGCVPSTKEYMQQVRELCTKEGILLIFDEVISGLRFRPGSAQGYYGVKPDLSTFAKAIANGFSLALVGGRAEIMDLFNPVGSVISSGTCAGNLMAVMVGIECLKMAMEPGFYDKIEKIETSLSDGVNDLFRKHGVPGHLRSVGARFAFYFGYDDPDIDYRLADTVKLYDTQLHKRFITECLEEKIYMFYPSDRKFPPHCGFMTSHTEEDIAITLEKFDKVFDRIKKK